MKAYVNGRLGGIEAGACGAGLRRRLCTGHNITE
jgi:hypothetical protein